MGSVILKPFSSGDTDEDLAIALKKLNCIALEAVIICHFIDGLRYGYCIRYLKSRRYHPLELPHDRVFTEMIEELELPFDLIYIVVIFLICISSKWFFFPVLVFFTLYLGAVSLFDFEYREDWSMTKVCLMTFVRAVIAIYLWVYLITWPFLPYNIRQIYYRNLDFPSNRSYYYGNFVAIVVTMELISIVIQCWAAGSTWRCRLNEFGFGPLFAGFFEIFK